MKDCVHCASSIPEEAKTCPDCGGNVSAGVVVAIALLVAAISGVAALAYPPAFVGVLVACATIAFAVAKY